MGMYCTYMYGQEYRWYVSVHLYCAHIKNISCRFDIFPSTTHIYVGIHTMHVLVYSIYYRREQNKYAHNPTLQKVGHLCCAVSSIIVNYLAP